MNDDTRAKIEHNHNLAAALQMLIGFADRPECYGPIPPMAEQFTQLADSYRLKRAELIAEYTRVTGRIFG